MMILKRFEVTPKFKSKLIIILTSVIVLVAVLQIWAVNRLSTSGDRITKLEKEKEALLMENQLLENEIASKSSLSEISGISKKLGYERISKLEYLKDQNLALNY